MNWGKRREAALQAIADGGPNYPAVTYGPMDGERLCQHCESFGNQDCPLHKPGPPHSTSRGLYQLIPSTWEQK